MAYIIDSYRNKSIRDSVVEGLDNAKTGNLKGSRLLRTGPIPFDKDGEQWERHTIKAYKEDGGIVSEEEFEAPEGIMGDVIPTTGKGIQYDDYIKVEL